ncbi:MAG: TonB-dependent receptor plug domain-containing protein [Steroidobacteraceae bacterium]
MQLAAQTDPDGGSGARQIYTAADFSRYAPKNAYDMLVQVPGFSIRDNEELRGLGQATGNVLFNGKRPSNKTDDMFTQLSRIPADTVLRIEIVDGASLELPGLSGQVANIVYRAGNFSGQYSWRPEFRAHYTDTLLTRASVSASGRRDDFQYELALTNDNGRRSGAGGPTLIFDRAGTIVETRRDIWNTHYDEPKLSANLTWGGADERIGHLSGHYQRIFDRYDEDGQRFGVIPPDQLRAVREINDSWNYEIGSDYQFPLGSGSLKLIGLRRFGREPFSQEIITRYSDASPATGDRFAQTGELAETIARSEYQWHMLAGDWQLSSEAAFNSLENAGALFKLDPSGNFVELPFADGSGSVKEDRYETLISVGHNITPHFLFQLTAGAERSTITQTGINGITRTFFRPKGSVTLAWTPTADFDASLKIRRRVLQLDFYDFLARAFLNDNNNNAGNNELRPQQDWSFEAEINKKLGGWGSSKLFLVYRAVEDRVDIVPLASGEGVGNIARSHGEAIRLTSTFNLDPMGLKGVKFDTDILFQGSGLRDPFNGQTRQWSGFRDKYFDVALRHDVPGSNWAWGAAASYAHDQPQYRSNQVDEVWEGPWFASIYAENKSMFGLTVRAMVDNLLGARSRRYRVVYSDLRGLSPVDFVEDRNRLIGPIFSLSVRGTF